MSALLNPEAPLERLRSALTDMAAVHARAQRAADAADRHHAAR